ncbi:EF-P beta-lysylation protein EpmB [Arhodomonas sp. AD133]|uniref:EF-P beta-lysylation protein EpmB n=1 Tax=Arhodomonas sp. AD133 TaxID=3415009 RepID=UPI003EB8DC6B
MATVYETTASSGAGTPAWQRELADAIRDPAELLAAVGLDASWLPAARRAAALFPLRVPRGHVARMGAGDPDDPLLRQVLPLAAEERPTPGFHDDPVGDRDVLHPGGVLHKYHGRVLLVATGACAINCRYCFRRHFPYSDAQAAPREWRDALAYIGEHPDIEEVILSGGDPLTLSDRRLGSLAESLDEIAHVRRLRIHSRLPVVLPERVDDAMLAWFAGGRLKPVMVLHANHPRELDTAAAEAVTRLRRHGVHVLNQAVLLRGVNDDADTLTALSERLFDIDVLPYYLHVLDPVAGAAHFDVGDDEAGELMRAIAARLPGYLVPRLVRELPGRPAKTWLTWDRAPENANDDVASAP